MIVFPPMTLAGVRQAYQSGASPEDVIREIWNRIDQRGDDAVWIWRPALADVLESLPTDRSLPLFGIPFAVKDNIDVAGWPTTAGCPSYAYLAEADARVVSRLRAAGAVPIGKTNLDQFATGLVGTRSPYGIPRCVFDGDYISGGSSSGSAVALAAGLCAFSLGTDTAGSGRVPAAFNGITGLKPTRGRVGTTGVVPACRSLDCVSVFTWTPEESLEILSHAEGYDADDCYSRAARANRAWPDKLRVGVLAEAAAEFFGNDAYRDAYAKAVAACRRAGAELVDVDWAPFRDTAKLLYQGAWVAERAVAVGAFVESAPPGLDPVVASILSGAKSLTAADAFSGAYHLEELRKQADAEWLRFDILLLPTAPTHFRVDEIRADPILCNSRLGTYTNFVNLLDLCAIAVPYGMAGDGGRPFGVTLMAPAWRDRELAEIAGQFARGEAWRVPLAHDMVSLAVVGAHLHGQPLHHQLTGRGARLLQHTKTSACYRLFALPNTTPPKPGLVREPGYSGPGLEVEVYALSAADFGSFVAEVPAPMGIGMVELADGSWVKGFLCEAYALQGATEITSFGGWRAWREGESQ